MKHVYTLSALALACAQTLPAQAQSKLEEVIVTSSRVEMPLRQVGTSVSVITEDDLHLRGFTSLYDVLRSSPGISANNTGGAGGITSLQIRGEDGYRTLVLIDDIDISDTTGTQVSPRMEHLQSSGIERVEILRGPQGMMYGADAGGVINIRTAGVEEGFRASAQAELGRYGSQLVAGGLNGGNGQFDYSVLASDYQTDGFNARDTGSIDPDDDGYDNTTVHGRLGWQVSDALRLQLVARDVDSASEYDGCSTIDFSPSNDCDNDFEQQAWRASLDYEAGRFTHQLAYSGNETDRQDYTEGLPTFGAFGERERVTYVGSFDGGKPLKLVYGVDLLSDSLDDGTFDRERDQDGYYLEYQGEVIEDLYLTAGVRYDDNDDFGSHTTWRTSAAYLIDFAGGELKFRGTYGTGFRAPSLYEIAYNDGSFAFSPASETVLEEETSEGVDVGVAWYSTGGVVLEANYFDQDIDDIIYFDLIDYSGYLQDSGKSNSKGVELIAQWPLADSLALEGNYTYNDTETTDGSERPRRPEHLGNIALSWSPLNGDLVFGLHVRAVSGAKDTDGSDMDNYQVVDFSANWQIVDALAVYARVENLFDEDYQEIQTYNTSGAAAYAGIRFSF